MSLNLFVPVLVASLISIGLVHLIHCRRKSRVVYQRLIGTEQLNRSILRLHRRDRLTHYDYFR